MVREKKIDKDAVQTAITITILSSIFGGLISLGFDEIKTWLESRREKKTDEPEAPSEI